MCAISLLSKVDMVGMKAVGPIEILGMSTFSQKVLPGCFTT